MAILVTGGAGFIGSHVVDALVRRDEDVVVVDNLTTGKRRNVHPRAIFYELDITAPEFRSIFGRHAISAVIHHAAQVDVTASFSDPARDALVNVVGTVSLLECCRHAGVGTLVYAASGGAGPGIPRSLPVDESHPQSPISPYGISKHTVEHYLSLYGDQYGLDWVSLRYANVYGPKQDPFGEGGVVAIFAHRFLTGEPPTIFGDGSQTRDFVYVGDVASANLAALERGGRLAVNVGTGQETSVSELADMLRGITGSSARPLHAPPRPGDIHRSVLDSRLAQTHLHWEPRVSLAEGLRLTVDFFRREGRRGCESC